MPDAVPRFCPFCRECFEDLDECPDHGLVLVRFERLPRPVSSGPSDSDRLDLYSPALGRGYVFAAIVALVVGFLLPAVRVVTGDQTLTQSGIDIASTRAPVLWTVPFAAAALVWLLVRRRTPRQMRGARMVVPLVGLAAAGALAHVLYRIELGAVEMATGLGRAVLVDDLAGVWVMAGGALLCLIAGLRLGVLPRAAPTPPSDDNPDDHEGVRYQQK